MKAANTSLVLTLGENFLRKDERKTGDVSVKKAASSCFVRQTAFKKR